jgi:hypothetical protein
MGRWLLYLPHSHLFPPQQQLILCHMLLLLPLLQHPFRLSYCCCPDLPVVLHLILFLPPARLALRRSWGSW